MAGPISDCGTADRAKLAERLAEILKNMDAWCARLEDFADRLPADVEASECLSIARDLSADIQSAHEFEERELFVTLRGDAEIVKRLGPALERLHSEHLEDESLTQEIRECLAEFAMDRRRCNVESLAYMLRGFFESKRRHCAFEREFLLPLLKPGQA